MENTGSGILKIFLTSPPLTFIPPLALSVLEFLKEKDGFLVGGAVRDILLSKIVKDLDILIPGDHSVLSGEAFDNWSHVSFSKKGSLVRMIRKDIQIDISFYPPSIDSLAKNLGKRDFTINCLAIPLDDLSQKEICLVDPLGGLEDLNSRLIRATSESNLKKDPLRLLRAYRLKSNLGFEIEKNTLKIIKSLTKDIKKVSIERIRDELFLILDCDSYEVLRNLYEIGIISNILPELAEEEGMDQGPYHDYDVLEHTFQTLKELESLLKENLTPFKEYDLSNRNPSGRSYKALLKLAAILHDIGKPCCRVIEGEKIVFQGHEVKGMNMTSDIALGLKLSKKEKDALEKLIKNHLRAGYLFNQSNLTNKAMRSFITALGDDLYGALFLFLADALATRKETIIYKENYIDFCQKIVSFKHLIDKKSKPLLNGHEIMKLLSISPGIEIGRLLNLIAREQEDGKITNKKQARTYLKEVYFSRAFE